MKVLVIAVAVCSLAVLSEARPFVDFRVAPLHVTIPHVTIPKVFGVVGTVLKAKAHVLHKVANLSGGIGAFLSPAIVATPGHVEVAAPHIPAHTLVVEQPVSVLPVASSPPPYIPSSYGPPKPY